jgi:hypothetical protein
VELLVEAAGCQGGNYVNEHNCGDRGDAINATPR